jgi:hypothetical protein
MTNKFLFKKYLHENLAELLSKTRDLAEEFLKRLNTEWKIAIWEKLCNLIRTLRRRKAPLQKFPPRSALFCWMVIQRVRMQGRLYTSTRDKKVISSQGDSIFCKTAIWRKEM